MKVAAIGTGATHAARSNLGRIRFRVMTSPSQHAAQSRQSFRNRAQALVDQLGTDCTMVESRVDLSELAVWFVDESDLLIVAVGPDELPATMDKVLAWAIAWQGDRKLVIICAEDFEIKTMERLPWIDRPITVHTYGGNYRLSPPKRQWTRDQTIALARDELHRPVRPLASHDLGPDTEALNIDDLVRRLDDDERLTRAGRGSYDAWTCAGKRVLVMRGKTTTSIQITAGVDYRKALPLGEQRALQVTVTRDDPLSSDDLEAILLRVDHACKTRLQDDRSYLEHRMQCNMLEQLPRGGGLAQLRIKDACREYPAYRGKGDPGLIDFLGLDVDNRIHVIETKANPDDVPVVLQAIDYAVWVMANQAEIRRTMVPGPSWEPTGPDVRIIIDFVCAPKTPSGKPIGPYMRSQLLALAPDLEWHLWVMSDALDARGELRELGRSELPKGIDGWSHRA